MKKPVLILLLTLLATGAIAQDTGEQELQPEMRRYTVEMIIFSYAENVAVGSEIFVPDLPPVEELLLDDDDLGAMAERSGEKPVEARDAYRSYELVMLNQDEFLLDAVYEKLKRLDAYRPLAHFGWTQPTYPGEPVAARPLSSFISVPRGLEGELTLYLSRYLHLAINLQLQAPVSYPVQYRIEEDRIFRNGELRYFDHPKFGVLAKITRVEAEDPADEPFEETELLGY